MQNSLSINAIGILECISWRYNYNVYKMQVKISKTDALEIIENAMSWLVVFAMLIYGGAKIVQFDGAADSAKPVSELTGMELMWAFYGYSVVYAIILGLLEITGAILIFFKKTRIIGCLFTSTILINIIIQDIIFDVNKGALRAAILYQILLLGILFLNKQKVMQGIKCLLNIQKKEGAIINMWVKFVLAFMLFVVLRVAEYYMTRME